MRLTGDFGELVMEVEQIDVTSNMPQPDRSWTYTDREGHPHYWRDGYPTLVNVDDETYWCGDCGEEHTDSHLECPLCHETIAPGLVGPPGYREFMPGRTSYILNGEPISEGRAQEFIEAMRRRASPPEHEMSGEPHQPEQ